MALHHLSTLLTSLELDSGGCPTLTGGYELKLGPISRPWSRVPDAIVDTMVFGRYSPYHNRSKILLAVHKIPTDMNY